MDNHTKTTIAILPLADLEVGQEADSFVLLAEKELLHTKDGKPFYKVVFRDTAKEIPTIPIWSDGPIFEECKRNWTVGKFYKIRALLRTTKLYGQQLEVRRIREIMDGDKQEGFDPNLCRPASNFQPEAMYNEILAIAKIHTGKRKLFNLITRIFKNNRNAIHESAAARQHHHAYAGGLLEHTLNVTKTAVFLADHYRLTYPKLPVPFSKPLVVAGAILHDIGKIRELRNDAVVSHHTTEGELFGHALLGRDIVREHAIAVELETPIRVHLEHIILSHQRFPDWGAMKPPMSLEAVLVHTADSCDALFGSYVNVFTQDDTSDDITSAKNRLGHALFRGTVSE